MQNLETNLRNLDWSSKLLDWLSMGLDRSSTADPKNHGSLDFESSQSLTSRVGPSTGRAAHSTGRAAPFDRLSSAVKPPFFYNRLLYLSFELRRTTPLNLP
ncbi:hypothetical protein PJP07_29630, partial [Mycobacterium kansasii]